MYHPAKHSNYPTHCGWTEIDAQIVFRANVFQGCRDRWFCTTQLHPTNSEYRQHAEDCGRGGKAVTWLAVYLHTSLRLKLKAGFLQ